MRQATPPLTFLPQEGTLAVHGFISDVRTLQKASGYVDLRSSRFPSTCRATDRARTMSDRTVLDATASSAIESETDKELPSTQ